MQKKATQKRRAKAKAKKKAQIAASPSQIAKLVDEQKEHELAASEKYKLWLERALKKEALREKDRNRKQCLSPLRERDWPNKKPGKRWWCYGGRAREAGLRWICGRLARVPAWVVRGAAGDVGVLEATVWV